MAFLVFVLIFLSSYFLWQLYKRSLLPPGPFPILFLGNIPSLAYYSVVKKQNILETLKQYQKEYGKVFTVWIGPYSTVHIVDYDIGMDVMVRQGANHSDRFSPHFLTVARTFASTVFGTIFSSGLEWQEHRRFNLKTLRNFGLGKNVMEQRIMEEFNFHFAKVEKLMNGGEATISPQSTFDMLAGSIINRLLFGYRFDEDNQREFESVKHPVDQLFNEMTFFDMLIQPWFKNVPGLKGRYAHLKNPQTRVMDFVNKHVEKRKADITSGEHHLEGEGEDFMDAYLIEQEKRAKDGDDIFSDFGLSADIFDLWIAGQETTALTLCWAFIYLLQNPHIMEKCRKEIHSQTNRNRDVCLADRQHTPYFNATILEIQRLASIVTLNLWRRNTEETKCGDYVLPADTVLTCQLSVIMNDGDYFEEPNKFNPDRYMTGGKQLEQMVIPFGIGKRACLGESLAKNEIYLILSNILQRYDLSIDPLCPPTEDAASHSDAIMHRCAHYKMKIKCL